MQITETNKHKPYVNKTEDLQRARIPIPSPGSITGSVLTLDEISMIQQKKIRQQELLFLTLRLLSKLLSKCREDSFFINQDPDNQESSSFKLQSPVSLSAKEKMLKDQKTVCYSKTASSKEMEPKKSRGACQWRNACASPHEFNTSTTPF